MSDSLEGPPSGGGAADVDGASIEPHEPRRIIRARRDAAEALEFASASTAPSWTVAPALDVGSSVPLDDELF
jgi:hypothetical protein